MISNRNKRQSLLGESEATGITPVGKYDHAWTGRVTPAVSTPPRGMAIFVFLVICVLMNTACVLFENYRYYTRPVPTESSPFNAGSVARTRRALDGLTSIGARITGTHSNEVAARDFILNRLEAIKAEASVDVEVEIDVQHPCGEFHLEYLNSFSNVYCNITNIVARLSLKKDNLIAKKEGTAPPAVLVNAHFDSFVMSPGASDDGLEVAVMLEVLRLVSRAPHPQSIKDSLHNPIVFLFNGAEESNLQGSHGFITQHKWAKSIRAVINLESIGSGGRELLFQCNSPWVAQVYADSAPYPHSSGIAHEVFQLALWRAAATDWRPFIEFGPPAVVGADFAHVENGYVYHTSFDTAQIIDDGTIMHTGSNILQFASALSAAPELRLPTAEWAVLNNLELSEDGEPVKNQYDSNFLFFDFLGIFQIVYSGRTVAIVHGLGVLLSLLVCWWKIPDLSALREVAKHVFYSQGACTLAAVATGLAYATFAPMRWYSGGYQSAAMALIPPILLADYVVHEKAVCNNKFGVNQGEAWEISGLIYWVVLLVVATIAGHRGSYLFLLWAVFGSASVMCRTVLYTLWNVRSGASTKLASSGPLQWKHIYIEFVSAIFLVPPSLCWLYQLTDALELVVPLMGKTGSVLNGDILLALLYSWMIASFLKSPILNPKQMYAVNQFIKADVSRSRKIFVYPLSFAMGSIFLYFCFISVPYSDSRPKRLWVHHIDRDLTDRGEGNDSGLWVVGFDALGLSPISDSEYISPQLSGLHRTSSFRGTWFPDDSRKDLTSRPTVQESRQGFNCAIMSAECYLYWPYYYPVAEVLRDAFYIPAKPPLLKGGSGDESTKIFSLSATSGEILNGKRFVEIFLSGPSHLTLVLRDNDYGKRIISWGTVQTTEESSKSEFINKRIELSKPPTSRLDGSHYLQIGFGSCTGSCLMRMRLEIEGTDNIDVTAYGHYVLVRSTEELTQLAKELPSWARGAEWTYFVSKLISTTA